MGQQRRTYEDFLNAQLGELRSLAAHPLPENPAHHGLHHAHRWTRIIHLAQSWRGERFLDVLPYFNAQLTTWPDEARVVPGAWKQRIFRGEELPQLAITRRLDYLISAAGSPAEYAKQRARLAMLLDTPHAHDLTHLSFDALELSPRLDDAIREATRAWQLTHLRVHAGDYHQVTDPRWIDHLRDVQTETLTLEIFGRNAHMMRVLAGPCTLTRGLRHLRLNASFRAPRDLDAMFDTDALAGLDTLRINSYLDTHALNPLLRSQHLPVALRRQVWTQHRERLGDALHEPT